MTRHRKRKEEGREGKRRMEKEEVLPLNVPSGHILFFSSFSSSNETWCLLISVFLSLHGMDGNREGKERERKGERKRINGKEKERRKRGQDIQIPG